MCFSAISYKHFLCFFFIIIIIIFFLANTGSSCQMRKVNITITSEVWNNTLLESESSEFRTLETSVLSGKLLQYIGNHISVEHICKMIGEATNSIQLLNV